MEHKTKDLQSETEMQQGHDKRIIKKYIHNQRHKGNYVQIQEGQLKISEKVRK